MLSTGLYSYEKFKVVADKVGERLHAGFYSVWDAFNFLPNIRLRQCDNEIQMTGKNVFI